MFPPGSTLLDNGKREQPLRESGFRKENDALRLELEQRQNVDTL